MLPSASKLVPHRMSPLRYGVYCLLSLLHPLLYQTVRLYAIYDSDAHKTCCFLFCSLTLAFFGPAVIALLRHYTGTPTSSTIPSQPYTAVLSFTLFYLGGLAHSIQEHTKPAPYPFHQVIAIHFALCFFLISECEIYRLYYLYWIAKPDRPRIQFSSQLFEVLLLIFLGANLEWEFEHSRDAVTYGIPSADLREPSTISMPPTFLAESRQTWVAFIALSFALFPVGMWPWNYAAMWAVNGRDAWAEMESVWALRGGTNPLFSTDRRAWEYFGALLWRPVRLWNRMVLWWCWDLGRLVWIRFSGSGGEASAEKPNTVETYGVVIEGI
ncbi:hypothetical protein CC80DRAFT_499887 [Byssothecium circinans]|uniref:Uncharacterized protein n=1 Tax=Byssothecium circinans TaxID=147558 RepID=A0A6A5UF05_9PLEO|nr:hypothetical protein CC80DRAFT_499887 [Byssothecium circinans]